MRDYHFFEFAWIDIVSAAKDHVVFTVNDGEIAFVIHHADIAGVEPTISKRLGGCFGAFIVPLHNIRPANNHLASFTRSNLVIVIIEALNIDAKDRLSDTTR